jgi:hypothetical protein
MASLSVCCSASTLPLASAGAPKPDQQICGVDAGRGGQLRIYANCDEAA